MWRHKQTQSAKEGFFLQLNFIFYTNVRLHTSPLQRAVFFSFCSQGKKTPAPSLFSGFPSDTDSIHLMFTFPEVRSIAIPVQGSSASTLPRDQGGKIFRESGHLF